MKARIRQRMEAQRAKPPAERLDVSAPVVEKASSSTARIIGLGGDVRIQNPKILERHFTVAELAEAWGLSKNTIRRMFQDDPDVLKIGKSFRRARRGYVTLRIPESAATRVHKRGW